MRRSTENLSPKERRFYWKFLGSLFGFCSALLIVTVGVLVGNHLSKIRALEPAMAQAIGEKLGELQTLTPEFLRAGNPPSRQLAREAPLPRTRPRPGCATLLMLQH